MIIFKISELNLNSELKSYYTLRHVSAALFSCNSNHITSHQDYSYFKKLSLNFLNVIITVNKWISLTGLKLKSVVEVAKLMAWWLITTDHLIGMTSMQRNSMMANKDCSHLHIFPPNSIIFHIYCFHHYGLLASWKHEHMGLTKHENRQTGRQVDRQIKE